MKSSLRVLVIIINILYPFAIFAGLFFLDAPMKVFPFALAGILTLNLFSDFEAIRSGNKTALLRLIGMGLAIGGVVLLMTLTENAGFAKLYPVFINISLLLGFGYSLVRPPTMVWRFATMADKNLAEHPERDRAERYCRKVTVIWCIFFTLNSIAALITALWASDVIWSVYNGIISYVLIGVLLVGEFAVRKLLRVGT